MTQRTEVFWFSVQYIIPNIVAGSCHTNTVAAFLLAIVSQLIQQVVQQLESILPPPQPVPVKSSQVNGHSKRRRRRRRRKGSIEHSSDLSEDGM